MLGQQANKPKDKTLKKMFGETLGECLRCSNQISKTNQEDI
jgi:hypothetical protein